MKTSTKFLAIIGVTTLALSSAAQAAIVYYDVDDVSGSTTQTDWISTNLNGDNNVTFTGVGATTTLDDRERTNNGGGTESDMWNSFIFANTGGTAGAGMNVKVTGLALNTTYNVQVWSYDDGTNGVNSADWTGSNGGTTATVTFNGGTGSTGNDPTSLSDYTATFTAVTDGSGTLTLQGRRVATSAQTLMILNGFSLEAVPEPSSTALLGLGGLALILRRRR